MSPRTGQETHVVIERFRSPRTYWVVPAGRIAARAEDSITLTCRRADLAAGPAYRRRRGEFLEVDPGLPPVVFPVQRPDAEIATDVRRALAAEPVLAGADIAVAVAGGEVRLTGLTPTAIGRVDALKLAESVAGVGHVYNDLLSDEEIATAINRRLKEDPELRRHQVRVRLTGGQVTVHHLNADADLLERAAQIARDHPGVRGLEIT